MLPVPDGFRPHTRSSPVTDPWQPILAAADADGTVRLGFHAAAAHCNGRGLVHGGVLAALADNAMGLSLVRRLAAQRQDGAGFVTTTLVLDYIAPARPQQWIEIVPRILQASGRHGVVDALILADGVLVTRANARFQRVPQEPRP